LSIHFRRLELADLGLVREWLSREHVKRWWTEPSPDEVVEHYGPAIEGREPTDLYVIQMDEEPIGFIQTYLATDHPDWERIIQVGKGVAGVDLFIGEPEFLGRGIGTRALTRFVEDIVFDRPTTRACVADPDAENVVSLLIFEKAGFSRAREFVDPGDDRLHVLMRRDR
jgi:aminoglycoside 6'-N-acetyltransferase